jgi:hypothetical protein
MDISERLKIEQQLAFLRAGGGRKSPGQSIGELFQGVGQGLGAAGAGLSSGQAAQTQALQNQKIMQDLNEPRLTGDQLSQLFSGGSGGSPKNAEAIKSLFGDEGIPVSKASGYFDLYNKVTSEDRQADREARQATEYDRKFKLGQDETDRKMEKMLQNQEEKEKRAEVRKETKALSGDAAKVGSIAKGMIPNLMNLRKRFEGDNFKATLTGFVAGTDRELVKLVEDTADMGGRLRSGGAINKPEEISFRSGFGSAKDLAAMATPFADATSVQSSILNHIDRRLAEAKTVMSGIDPSGKRLGGSNQGGADQFKIGDVKVGANGQKGTYVGNGKWKINQ